MYSETLKAQSKAGTLSKNTSGRGPYTLRSGNRSCTSAKDVSVNTKLKARIIAAENDNRKFCQRHHIKVNKSDGIITTQQNLHT